MDPPSTGLGATTEKIPPRCGEVRQRARAADAVLADGTQWVSQVLASPAWLRHVRQDEVLMSAPPLLSLTLSLVVSLLHLLAFFASICLRLRTASGILPI